MGIWPNHRGITTQVEDKIHSAFKRLALEDGETPASLVRLLILAELKRRTELEPT